MALVIVVAVFAGAILVLVAIVEMWNEDDDDHSTHDIENARQKKEGMVFLLGRPEKRRFVLQVDENIPKATTLGNHNR